MFKEVQFFQKVALFPFSGKEVPNLVDPLDWLKCDVIHQTQLIYLLIVIRLATCFAPAGSSSGLHYEPNETTGS